MAYTGDAFDSSIGQCAEVPCRQEKHVELQEAINGMDSACYNIDRLIDRLRGPDVVKGTEENCKAKTPTPSFLSVLECGPSTIRANTEAINKRIDELNELLF